VRWLVFGLMRKLADSLDVGRTTPDETTPM
jgi:hypothetical protein